MAEGRKGFFGRFGRNRAGEEGSAAPATEPKDEAPEPTEAAPEPAETEAFAQPDEPIGPVTETIEPAGEAEAPVELPAPEDDGKPGWLSRLRSGLGRSSSALTGSISSIFTKRKLDEATLEEFEEALIRADLGIDTAAGITDTLRRERIGKELGGDEVKAVLAAELEKALLPVAKPLELDPSITPNVILVVGVNGTGKTTTIGKLAAKLAADGKQVMLAAGDTFRAAAIDQLKIWGDRIGAPVEAREVGADAAGLAFDALARAKAEGADVLLIDTAGRLQNKTELMAELEKIIRVIRKKDPDAPHHVLLTLDATTGQNALSQVEIFAKTSGVTGLVMTKLDGTARGGILVAVAAKFGLPVHFIGVGEGVDDLEPFDAADFAGAIAGLA